MILKNIFMKKIYLIIFIALLFNSKITGQVQFVNSFGAGSNDYGTAVISDVQGNIYTAGYFRGTCDFDPGPGVYTMSSTGYQSDNLYVVKLDSLGNFIWAIQTSTVESNVLITASSILIDGAGNICIAGYFNWSVDFDPGSNTFNLVSSSVDRSGFIWKIDSGGNFVSAIGIMGGNVNHIKIRTDMNQNIYMTGTHFSTFDADPGSGTYFLASNGSADAFLIKFNSNGNLLFAYSIGGSDTDYGQDLCVTNDGYIYCIGYFSSTVDFDFGSGVFSMTAPGSYYGYDAFILKLDTLGNFVWAKKITNVSANTISFHIALDSHNNLLFTGNYNNSTDFEPSTGTYHPVSFGSNGGYIEKLDPLGNFLWVKALHSSAFAVGVRNIKLDIVDNIYIAGELFGAADFDPSPGIYQLTESSINLRDGFACKLESSGDFIWAKLFGGMGYDVVNDICLTENNQIVLTGYYTGTALFGSSSLTSAGGKDAFVTKIRIVANKISGKIYYDLNGNGSFDIQDSPATGTILLTGTNLFMSYIDTTTANYHFYADTGSYVLTVANPPSYYILSPTQHLVSFGNQTIGNDTANDFIFTPVPNIKDIQITLSAITDAVKGMGVIYNLTYKNLGTDTLSGTIFLKPDNLFTFNSSQPIQQNVNSDTVFWNYSNLAPREERSIIVNLTLSITATPGDSILSICSISPILLDTVPQNNTSVLKQEIKSSHDPNKKIADLSSPLDSTFLSTPDYITYTIYFQNTGTSLAVNITIKDTLDNTNLDLSTLEMLSSSHYTMLTMENNIVQFYFPNINLPTLTNSPQASQGAVTYKIKTKNTFALGDLIKNTGYIYFDFNPAIITNTTTHYITIPPSNVGLENYKVKKHSLFPNPTSDKLFISPLVDKDLNIVINDILGHQVFKIISCNEINVSSLAPGVYFINLINTYGGIEWSNKFIKIDN